MLLILVLVYRPWEPQPFDILDYSEFLPILKESSAPGEAVSSLIAYYGGHGRWSPITHAFIAANWSLFGELSVGWMWTRAILMVLNGLLAFALLRRLQFSPVTAGLCSTLLLVVTPASAAVIRLTGEPVALMALISALILASRYQSTERWRMAGVGIAVLGCIAILAKETLLLLMPFLLLFALASEGGQLRRPFFSIRNRWLLGWSLLLMTLNAVAVVLTLTSARPDGYMASYGGSTIEFGRFLGMFIFILLPVHFVSVDPVLAYVAAFLYLSLLVIGLDTWLPRSRGSYLVPLLLLGLPLMGALTYLPWPRFESYYALPYFVGPLVMLALALHALEENSRAAANMGRGLCGLLVIVCALAAYNQARAEAAARRLDWALMHRVASLPGVDTVVVGVRGVTMQSWQGTGPTLARFANAIGVPGTPFPPAVNYPCDVALERARRGGSAAVVVVLYAHECDSPGDATFELFEEYSYFDISRARLDAAQKRVSVIRPPAAGVKGGPLP